MEGLQFKGQIGYTEGVRIRTPGAERIRAHLHPQKFMYVN